MHTRTSAYAAYGTLLIAVAAWMAVGLLAHLIRAGQAEYAARVQEDLGRSTKAASDVSLHTAASSNTARSQQLDALVAADVPTIINIIRSVGTVSGVEIKISAALPGSMPKNQKDVHAAAFVIDSTGSFAQLMRTLALFESLPFPSSIDTVDFSQVMNTTADGHGELPWRMNLKMQVLTTAPVS